MKDSSVDLPTEELTRIVKKDSCLKAITLTSTSLYVLAINNRESVKHKISIMVNVGFPEGKQR